MLHVGILLFDDVELLDFAGPYEVFSVAAQLHGYALFHVFTITADGMAIRSINGLRVQPDFRLGEHPAIDVLILPGGDGTKALLEQTAVMDWIATTHGQAQITMSVCSGARLLGKLGLLDGIDCTTHHEVMAHLAQIAPKALIRPVRYTDGGKLCTSAGICAGIDLSLHIVERLCGAQAASRTREYMEYGDWVRLP